MENKKTQQPQHPGKHDHDAKQKSMSKTSAEKKAKMNAKSSYSSHCKAGSIDKKS